MDKTCVCLICFKPNDIWIEFLSKFTKYDVFIIIDDNSKDYKDKYFKFTPKECIFTWTELCNTETKEKEKKSSETKEKRA